jgi:hypothetical protein
MTLDPRSPRWNPQGDLFGLAICGVLAVLVIAVVRALSNHVR